MKNTKRLFETYKFFLGILMKNIPVIVVSILVLSVLSGFLSPLSVYVNTNIFNLGIAIAEGNATFSEMIPFLILFILCAILPNLFRLYQLGVVEPRSILVLRSAFRAEMLQKLKRMKYEHLESEASMEIIDKAYSRAENSAKHLFPMYLNIMLSSIVGAIGSLYIIISIKWWLIFPILLPFVLETVLSNRNTYNIYVELESYWKKEKNYGTLSSFFQNREYVRENRLNQASEYLIGLYSKRFAERNRKYEGFFFKNLRKVFLSSNISRIAVLGNVLILLFLYLDGQLDMGRLISVSLLIFGPLYEHLSGSVFIFKWGHYHAGFFEYYRKYFDLSEDDFNEKETPPLEEASIEFRDVWFRYPGTQKDILRGLSFFINPGEKVSVVGENGEGKSTMVKLLLGLFTLDKGEIFIGKRKLESFSYEERLRLFGTVFQDFGRYSITLKENIVIGDLFSKDDDAKLSKILKKTKTDIFTKRLPEKENTLLGKDFEGGTDLSGGQWQRIAIARALFGNNPFLILDEPTSQLDPLAESALYSEFAEIADGRTSLFITHRLGSTAITDRIVVISKGVVAQIGTHEELLAAGGLYAEMYNAQKNWYDRNGEEHAYEY